MDSSTRVPYICPPMDSEKRATGQRDSLEAGVSVAGVGGRFSPLAAIRAAIAGVLMGVANVIPGVSGGTMILAMGLYEEFIDSVAEITALRFSWRRVIFLAIVGGAAAGTIIGLAGVILSLLFYYTVAMFSLFIGLTLGGAPLLLRSLRPVRADVVLAVLAGLGLMVVVFIFKGGAGFPHNTGMDLVSGVVGSTTMVLPGISGSYMLLVMDQYDRVVGAVRDLEDGIRGPDMDAVIASLRVVVPVGIGVLLGIVILSNALKILLRRFHRATVGVLLGLLLGSVIGLWPFTQSVGEKALEARSFDEVLDYARARGVPGVEEIDDKATLIEHLTGEGGAWSRRTAPPVTTAGVTTALVMMLVGFAATSVLSRASTGTRDRYG
jgi:putative membrane protein